MRESAFSDYFWAKKKHHRLGDALLKDCRLLVFDDFDMCAECFRHVGDLPDAGVVVPALNG